MQNLIQLGTDLNETVNILSMQNGLLHLRSTLTQDEKLK